MTVIIANTGKIYINLFIFHLPNQFSDYKY